MFSDEDPRDVTAVEELSEHSYDIFVSCPIRETMNLS